jgi:hypothetical protein
VRGRWGTGRRRRWLWRTDCEQPEAGGGGRRAGRAAVASSRRGGGAGGHGNYKGSAVRCTTLHYTALHCTAPHCTALRCISLHRGEFNCYIATFSSVRCMAAPAARNFKVSWVVKTTEAVRLQALVRDGPSLPPPTVLLLYPHVIAARRSNPLRPPRSSPARAARACSRKLPPAPVHDGAGAAVRGLVRVRVQRPRIAARTRTRPRAILPAALRTFPTPGMPEWQAGMLRLQERFLTLGRFFREHLRVGALGTGAVREKP